MTRPLLERLAIPALMASLLLLGLAYWWLDNLVHELAGTAMFMLLVRHLFINRTWFKQLRRVRYDVRRALVLILHAIVAASMAVLFITSLVISRTVFVFLPLPELPYLREIHWFSAYWVVVIVGIHLGTHWHRVMALTAPILRAFSSRWLAMSLRLLAIGGAAYGLWSFGALGVGGKLTFTYGLDFWDFTSSVSPFFAHWTGVLCLFGVATHYGLAVLKAVGPRAAEPPAYTGIQPKEKCT